MNKNSTFCWIYQVASFKEGKYLKEPVTPNFSFAYLTISILRLSTARESVLSPYRQPFSTAYFKQAIEPLYAAYAQVSSFQGQPLSWAYFRISNLLHSAAP